MFWAESETSALAIGAFCWSVTVPERVWAEIAKTEMRMRKIKRKGAKAQGKFTGITR